MIVKSIVISLLVIGINGYEDGCVLEWFDFSSAFELIDIDNNLGADYGEVNDQDKI
jgi:hypothetical protein